MTTARSVRPFGVVAFPYYVVDCSLVNTPKIAGSQLATTSPGLASIVRSAICDSYLNRPWMDQVRRLRLGRFRNTLSPARSARREVGQLENEVGRLKAQCQSLRIT